MYIRTRNILYLYLIGSITVDELWDDIIIKCADSDESHLSDIEFEVCGLISEFHNHDDEQRLREDLQKVYNQIGIIR